MGKHQKRQIVDLLERRDASLLFRSLAELGDRTSPDGKEHVSRANSTKSVNEKVNGILEDTEENEEEDEEFTPWTGWGNESYEVPKKNIYADVNNKSSASVTSRSSSKINIKENEEKDENEEEDEVEEEDEIWPPGSP